MWRRGGGGRGQAGAVAAQCDMACALGGRGGWGANSRRKDRGENIWVVSWKREKGGLEIRGGRRDSWEGRGEQLRGGVCARKKEWEGR